MSIGTLILVWVLCAIFLGPLISLLGLNRSHEDEARVTPEQWQMRIHHLLGYVGLLGGTAGALYLVGRTGNATDQLALFILGFPVLIVVLALVARLVPAIRPRNVYYLVLCAIFAVGIFSYRADLDAKAARAEQVLAAEEAIAAIDRQAIREWIEDLHAAGAHGPAGEIPPMLQVEDTGDNVQVKNLSSVRVCLQLYRQSAERNAQNPFKCTLLSRNREGDCTYLGPGSSDWFELANPQGCVGEPLSFKLGERSDPTIAWWSDPEIEVLKEQLKNPASYYGNTGHRFTLDDVHASYQAMLRRGDRAANWRKHIEAAELVNLPPTIEERATRPSAEPSTQLSAAHKHVLDLERLKGKLDPADRGLPDYLKVSSDWKDEIVLANASYGPRRVRLLRVGRDAQGETFLCTMQGDESGPQGTLIAARESATFRLAPGSPCPANKRLPLQAEVRDESGSLVFASSDLLDLRIEQAKQELALLKRSTN